MSKLFVFAIGGTGSRVLRAMAMLMAAGVRMNADQVIPVIIDPDTGNHDLTRALNTLKTYRGIHEGAGMPDTGFFSTQVRNIFREQDPFRMEFEGVAGRKFSDYINFNALDKTNQAFARLLFSEEHLNLNMQVGFKGNPNLGSIVLNQFEGNEDYQHIALEFAEGDRIFIISSIHGGTGAAGFPLLLKNLLRNDGSVPNGELISKAAKGAITVLPYYKLQAGEIKSEDFVAKTRAALEYYVDNVSPALNAQYYIGYKDHTRSYENHPGGNQQKNPAHFVELAAALSVFDFMKEKSNLHAGQQFKEFGIPENSQKITFDGLDSSVKEWIREPLTKFMLLSKFLDVHLERSAASQPWGARGEADRQLGSAFLKSDFMKTLKEFNGYFKEWMGEMEANSPSFQPFQLNAGAGQLMDVVRGQSFRKGKWNMKNFVLFDHLLNGAERKKPVASIVDKEKRFLTLLDTATEEMITKHL